MKALVGVTRHPGHALPALALVREAALEGYDALALGCFYDPGLDEARQAARGMPVIGPCQAAILAPIRSPESTNASAWEKSRQFLSSSARERTWIGLCSETVSLTYRSS